MDQLDLETSTIDLNLDEEQELTFEVEIQGKAAANPVYRFVCEADGMSMAFRGVPGLGGTVNVKLPALSGMIAEGKHSAHLEVIIENKLFVPMQLMANFKVPTKVVAESVRVASSTTTASAPVSGVSAKIVTQPSTTAAPVQTIASAPTKKMTLAEVYETQKSTTAAPTPTQPKEPSSAELLEKLWAADKKLNS